MSTNLFKAHTQAEHATSIAHYLPGGPLFDAAFRDGTISRSLFIGIAAEFERAEQQLILLSDELDPRETTLFIEEWERNVGIPDDCFDVAADLATRRRNVLIKLVSLGVQTNDDYIALGNLLGFSIQIDYPIIAAVLPQIVPFIVNSSRILRFTWIVRANGLVVTALPQIVPFIVGDSTEQTILQCLFNKLKPANTLIIYENS